MYVRHFRRTGGYYRQKERKKNPIVLGLHANKLTWVGKGQNTPP